MEQQVRAIRNRTPYHSLELPGGEVIEGIIPVARLRERIEQHPIPRDLRGKRVLDVGAASGWNSFELEKRGAEVVALDCVAYPEFHFAKRALDSRVEYVLLDVDEISKERLGTFDYVVCFGVLYHLRHPLLALEKICSITRDVAFIESYVIDPDASFPGCIMEFYETTELGGQIDNWWGPTVQCLGALCRSAGFGSVDFLYAQERRAGFACHRRWTQALTESTAPPLLCFAVNNRFQDNLFSPGKDEYITITLKRSGEIERKDVLVEIDGLAVPVLSLNPSGPERWQANTRLPPGLDPGRHEVRLRSIDSAYSNALGITVIPPNGERIYEPAPARGAVRLELVAVGADPAQPVREISAPLPVYFRCEPDAAESVVVEIDGRPAEVLARGFYEEAGHQANCRLPDDLKPGRHDVRVRSGECGSALVSFEFDPADAEW